MYKSYVNNNSSCEVEFEEECIGCHDDNYNTFGIECNHTNRRHHITHEFTLMKTQPYFEPYARNPHCNHSVDSKCCHVQVNCINESFDNKTLTTVLRILCTHAIGEDHTTHVFNVADLKDYNWKRCDCASDLSSSDSE